MRRRLIGLGLALVAASGMAARAQVQAEAIPEEALMQLGPVALQLIQQLFPDPAVKVDPDITKVKGYHVEETVGVVVLPDKNLTPKAIEEANGKEVPVAVVATKSLSVRDKESVINGDKLAVADLNGTVKLPVFFLSVKNAGAERRLQVYSKENGQPVLSMPLKKQMGAADVPVNLKLSNIDLPNKKLDVTFSLAGSYEATVSMGVLDF